MPILTSSGDVVTPPIPNPWVGIDAMTWTDWTGNVFDLLGSGQVLLLKDGIQGMNTPPHDRYSDVSPAVAGSGFRGSRIKDRAVFWPTYVYSDVSSDEYLAADRAFWRGMDPDKVGVWSVTTRGDTRSLTMSFEGDGDHRFTVDPILQGWEVYGLDFVAEQPYWTGAPILRLYSNAPETNNFFDSTRTLGSSFTLSSATVSNPGDVEAYPVWTIFGPATSTTITIGGQVIEVPITLTSGQTLTIDTNPGAQSAVMGDGTKRTGDLGARGFAPIQPGITVPLGLSMTGNGAVAVALTPLYRRAF